MLLAASFLEVLLSAPRGGSEGRDDETTMDHLSTTLLLILLGSGCSDAATELLLRRSRYCDGAAQTSSVAPIPRVALIPRVASERRDARNDVDETSIPIHFPPRGRVCWC